MSGNINELMESASPLYTQPMRGSADSLKLTDLQKRLLNDFQRDFPLSPTPYRDIAERLDVTEANVIAALTELHDRQLISRIGAVVPPNQVGVSTLAAMSVPEAELQRIAEFINGFPEVNHNYEREHRLNLWFVAVAGNAEQLQAVISRIEQHTGLSVLQLPLLDDFFIDLGFKMDWRHA